MLLGVFAVFTFAGLSKFAYFHLDDLARGHDYPYQARLIEELTGAYSMALVFLVLVWVVNCWPLERDNWPRRLPGYALLVVVAALVHTTLVWGSRLILFPLAGLGSYDYGIMRYRYPMEFAINGPNVVVLIAVLHAWRYYRRSRQRELETAPARGRAQPSPTRATRSPAPAAFPVQYPECHFLAHVSRSGSGRSHAGPAG